MLHASRTRTQACHILGLLVVALLAMLSLPPDARAQSPTGSIPSLNATVTSLRFFESAYRAPPREQRAYTQRFDPARTRYVHWELTLEHPAPGRQRVFTIQSVWHHPDGRVLDRLTIQTVVGADWTWSYHNHSWTAVGPWPVGTYRVVLYVQGQQVASGAFEMGAAPSPAAPSPAAPSAAEQNAQGQRYFTQKKWEEALAAFNAAIAQDPTYADAYSNRAALYHRQGLYDRAIADATTALTFNPRSGVAYLNRGLAYTATGQAAQALADYTQAIEVGPHSLVRNHAYTSRAALYAKQGQTDQAIADYTQAIALEPDEEQAYHHRGALYADVKRQYDQAIADYTKAIMLNSKYAKAYESMAIAYYNKGDYTKAWVYVRQAQALDYQVAPTFLETLRKESQKAR
jgi:tetratricopeptide (TPR) repeat protein